MSLLKNTGKLKPTYDSSDNRSSDYAESDFNVSKSLKNSDNLRITVNEQITSLYAQIAKSLSTRLNQQDKPSYEKVFGNDTIARKILNYTVLKIRQIEQEEDDIKLGKSLILSIGTISYEFISQTLLNSRKDGMIDLFNEAISKLFNRKKKKSRKHHNKKRHHRRRKHHKKSSTYSSSITSDFKWSNKRARIRRIYKH